MNSNFKKFIDQNLKFYKKNKSSNRSLVISVTNDLIFNTILFKFSKSISQIESSQSIFIPYLKFNSKFTN